jgi:hypothetical protein
VNPLPQKAGRRARMRLPQLDRAITRQDGTMLPTDNQDNDCRLRCPHRERTIIRFFTHPATRKLAQWLRIPVSESEPISHRLGTQLCCHCGMQALHLDDRTLADIALGRCEIECACRKRHAPAIEGRAQAKFRFDDRILTARSLTASISPIMAHGCIRT